MSESENDTPHEGELIEEAESQDSMSPFLPLTLLAISVLIFLGWQVSTASSQRDALQQAITSREPAVAQAGQIQAVLQKVVMDLFEAAKEGDADAKALVAKYGIQFDSKAAAPGAAASPAAK